MTIGGSRDDDLPAMHTRILLQILPPPYRPFFVHVPRFRMLLIVDQRECRQILQPMDLMQMHGKRLLP